ncbi:hypothetical protein SNE40_020001 [Patella caerulea]|uniref:SH3 domain-containing protein n=1 Tax=Patella caerulea TaxID=87958 RepID=A0AAN8IZ67_PATCE
MEALVEYEYESVQDDELSLKVGNVVKNISQAEDGWMKGELDGKKGVFPENFVRILQSSDKGQIILDKGGLSKREAPQRKSVRELASNFRDFAPMGLAGPPPKRKVEKKKCKVIYEYKPENEDELELQLGDMVDFIKEVSPATTNPFA